MGRANDVLRTLSAKCRDCYRCVRACPVNAIGIKNNQAFVEHSRCIVCGICLKECPQYAKVFRDDIAQVAELIKGENAVASIAPSFSAIYGGGKAKSFPSALRKLGFQAVSETAEGAALVAAESTKTQKDGDISHTICSACPVVVNYIQKYCPAQLGQLIPVVSPMIAHARLLKKIYGETTKVIFIGPCIAKKEEAQRPEYQGDVDVVLTFSELDRWLAREGVDLESCAESGFDNFMEIQEAKLFALPGGMLKTMGISNDGTRKEIMHTSGMSNVKTLLDSAPDVLRDLEIIEPLFCNEGCINGPGIESKENLFQRRSNLISYTASKPRFPAKKIELPQIDLVTIFDGDEFVDERIKEEQIIAVFEQMGKEEPESRLNCGACGHTTCREKAKAVIRGMAEKEMCVPFMRKLAEQRTDKIIETSPNGIVILDEGLSILSMNSAFCKFFTCTNSIAGKKISYLLDAQAFEKLAAGIADYREDIITCYGKEFHQIVYKLPLENQFVGIYMDISGIIMTEAKMDRMKKQTVEKAQELLDHQIKMTQTLAKFLGDSTAHSEELVERLMGIYES